MESGPRNITDRLFNIDTQNPSQSRIGISLFYDQPLFESTSDS